MDARPRDLADKIAHADEQLITLPLNAARRKAREIIEQSPRNGKLAVIGSWRQLADGKIEFAVRYFAAPE
ncbi:MAG: hypothetical protein GY844_04200 [Bradyrhizobium sp.]|nr:hypothetical protein [Bradyrhizobium sp.]